MWFYPVLSMVNLIDGMHVYCTDLGEKLHATKRSTKACVATTCSAHIIVLEVAINF